MCQQGRWAPKGGRHCRTLSLEDGWTLQDVKARRGGVDIAERWASKRGGHNRMLSLKEGWTLQDVKPRRGGVDIAERWASKRGGHSRMLSLKEGWTLQNAEPRREVDTLWCVSEDARPQRGVDCEIPHQLESGKTTIEKGGRVSSGLWSHIGWGGKQTFFIRVWKLLPSRHVLKILRGCPKELAQGEQYPLAVSLSHYS